MKISAEQEVYTFLRQAIISRKLLPNEQIVETNIVEQSGLSRTPVRAALKRLANDGLVVLKPNKGAFVVNPSHKEVRDLFECKMMYEVEIAALAAAHITESEILHLRQILDRTVEYHRHREFNYFLELNYDFHMVIAHAADNYYLEKISHELLSATSAALLVYDDFREVPLEEMESFKEHNQIITALRDRDENLARRTMVDHLLNTYQTLHLSLPLRYVYPLE